MTVNSTAVAAVTNRECAWGGDMYACLITYMINECHNNNMCYGYDGYQMEINHGEGAVAFCLGEIGGCMNQACEFFDSAQSTMVNDATAYSINYVYEDVNGTGLTTVTQRAIEIGVMDTLVNWGLCTCDWNTQYLYPRQSFGGGLMCGTCPDGGYAIYGTANFPAGIETCHIYGDIPFTDNIGSGYQAGPCPYIPSSSDWSPNYY